jgi:hypothetical protein
MSTQWAVRKCKALRSTQTAIGSTRLGLLECIAEPGLIVIILQTDGISFPFFFLVFVVNQKGTYLARLKFFLAPISLSIQEIEGRAQACHDHDVQETCCNASVQSRSIVRSILGPAEAIVSFSVSESC